MEEGKQITLKNNIPTDFPNIVVDENRLIQILFNLLHNAVKYTKEGYISIDAYVRKGKAHIVIKDTGIGMSEETIRHVFEPYQQASTGELDGGGIGIGLSVCKNLVELHGGTIQVESTLGKGSIFTFTLEVADATIHAEEARATVLRPFVDLITEPKDEQKRTLTEDRPRVLAVDDDPLNLKILETLLPSKDYDLKMVTSAQEALACVEEREWDLIISDVMMPVMSGYELTRMIRTRYSLTELPVLLLTARSRSEDIEHGFLVGANDYVTKPVDMYELRSRVWALTQYKKSVREQLKIEVAWLQAQIQPHFFFNTLNTIIAFSELDVERMKKLLEKFSEFLHGKFKFEHAHELVPIEEELDIVRSYLYIEGERFGERLNIIWNVDEAKGFSIPPLSIQPIIENAVRHGIMKRGRGGTIRIDIKNNQYETKITITDDGVGMDEEAVQKLLERRLGKTSGIGLLNVDLRLKRLYRNGLQIESKKGEGTKISFTILHDRGKDDFHLSS